MTPLCTGLRRWSSFCAASAIEFRVNDKAPIDPRVRIRHVPLKVANLDRSLRFYRDVLGLEETQRIGDRAAFLAAPGSGYHHHIGLNTWESAGGSPPPPGST